MKKLLQFILFVAVYSFAIFATGQPHNVPVIFAHNDYHQPIPFYEAYHCGAGFIEADVFLSGGKLLVAHDAKDLKTARSIQQLYFNPLREEIRANGGTLFPEKSRSLALFIDVKTEAVSTLKEILSVLLEYPQLTACEHLEIVISGNRPPQNTWVSFPDFILFDGRPFEEYTGDQLKRVRLISDDFKKYSSWNGLGLPKPGEQNIIRKMIDESHRKGKPVRFWGSPDELNAWIKLAGFGMDILNTDKPGELSKFLKEKSNASFTNTSRQHVYRPSYSSALAKSPKNVILLIGDGMGLAQLYAGFTANHGEMNIFEMRDIGFSITTSTDNYITDSAAGATAMATGQKTRNRAISVDTGGIPLIPITTPLRISGYKTAIISMGDITDATAAVFYAHQPDRGMSSEIAADFFKAPADILVGGGEKHFRHKNTPDYRPENEGSVSTIRLSDDSVVSKMKGRGDFLVNSLEETMKQFSNTKKPFFIMAEGAQIDYGGHENNMEYVVREVLDFDKAVGAALKFADSNKETLVIVTADHETGGLSLIDGDISRGYVHGHFSTHDHTGIMVPVFAYGPGAAAFRGVYQNTEIYSRLKILLRLK